MDSTCGRIFKTIRSQAGNNSRVKGLNESVQKIALYVLRLKSFKAHSKRNNLDRCFTMTFLRSDVNNVINKKSETM